MPPNVHGTWTGAIRTPGDTKTLGDGQGAYPVHLVLLHTGRVLMFSGGWEMQELLHRSWTFDPATFNPAAPTAGVTGRWFLPQFDDDPIANPPPPTTTHDPDIDLFCAHHVQIEDGRILVVGGDSDGHHNDSIHFYDPVAERWSRIPEQMVAPRWYPTAAVMPDGSVTVFSGDSHATPTGLVVDAEIMSPGGYVPRVISGGRRNVGGVERALYMYPGLFLVPGGRLFYVPISFDIPGGSEATVAAQMGNTSSFRITDATSTPPVGVWQDHGVRPAIVRRQEGTAVLLSPAQAGRIALIGGGQGGALAPTNSVEILDTQAAPPTWVPGGQMHRTRGNVNAVLLPDGKVLIFGGTGGYKWDIPPTTDQRRFTGEIWDPSVPYDPLNPTAAFLETELMGRSRMYHSGGVLLPDGRVLVAAGEDEFPDVTTGPGPRAGERWNSSQRTMEFYEPPYMHNGARPAITGIRDTGGLSGEIFYGGSFTITTAATNIDTVALMRPGATTHHTDTEQRHVPLVFWQVDGGYRARVPADASVVPPGYYMVWIVDDQGRPCQRASFVHLGTRSCTLVTDRSQFSLATVQSEAVGGVSSFDASFYVIVDGYRPEQLGITTTTPTPAQLAMWAPTVTFTDSGTGAAITGLDDYVTAIRFEVASLNVRQRITFEYGVRFTGTAMFPAPGAGDERRPVRLTGVIDGRTCIGEIDLFLQPNPYMVDGSVPWLSDDLRVFQIRPNGAQSGITFPPGGTPQAYLQSFLTACDGATDAPGHPFRLIATDQNSSRLELSATVDGNPVYNFAIARVRYQAESTPANDVRVFFRAFTTAAASMEYRPQTYPWDPTTNLPTVGASATDVLTIPFFSVPRAGVTTSGDTQNVKTMPIGAAGAETLRYFGAWLDINSTTAAITDPADGVVKSVQNLIRGKHQCLVTEIRFGPDPIEVGATPASHENLAQRNLAIVESDNPGPTEAHTIAHTFQLSTTSGERKRQGAVVTAFVEHQEHGDLEIGEGGFDELMIDWGGLPEEAEAMLYMPRLSADDILAAEALRYGPPLLEKVDEHTIRCRVEDMTFVPLAAHGRDVAGLLTIHLPTTVRTGQSHRVVVRHHSRLYRRVMGTFELFVPVRDGVALLAGEARLLAVLRSIAASIARGSAWFDVFERYIAVVASRVRALGGDPDRIGPSAEGTVPGDALPKPEHDDCCEQVVGGLRRLKLILFAVIIVLLILILLLILLS